MTETAVQTSQGIPPARPAERSGSYRYLIMPVRLPG